MDILYYSNYCKNSKKVLQSLAKTNVKEKISFICIDNRRVDPKTNQTMIMLENGKMVIMPPNLVYVPSLLLVKDKYKLLLGDQIIEHLDQQLSKAVPSKQMENLCVTTLIRFLVVLCLNHLLFMICHPMN